MPCNEMPFAVLRESQLCDLITLQCHMNFSAGTEADIKLVSF